MNRRRFLSALTLGTLAAPLTAKAQRAGKVYRVGLVGLTGAASMSLRGYQAFRRRLAELGWVEGKNLVFESRWAEGQIERLPKLIQDVAATQPQVIYVLSSAAAAAAKKANLGVPVVFSHVTDPVASGVVPTLGRHGGNITGVDLLRPGNGRQTVRTLARGKALVTARRRRMDGWPAGEAPRG
jgi:putative tryptophan/tyrosine transport system substrate-binding protein